ncbi:hypothetical protein SCHPADRAFT_747253 [Schizopora paradoxa]|uniref:Uncharacterized protein n=1 Tax=Schizopora paradoxa TaxID=27342 RepID=A0A0H2RIN2_9AGAM|nr:hypothetical protein SCHPADRAFT_747253 [Schizopora paradoxa]
MSTAPRRRPCHARADPTCPVITTTAILPPSPNETLSLALRKRHHASKHATTPTCSLHTARKCRRREEDVRSQLDEFMRAVRQRIAFARRRNIASTSSSCSTREDGGYEDGDGMVRMMCEDGEASWSS